MYPATLPLGEVPHVKVAVPDDGGPGGVVSVSVTGTVRGLFVAPEAVIVIVAL